MRNFASPVRKINHEVIGLDVHQRVIAACCLDRRGRQVAEHQLEGTREALEAFLQEYVGRRRPHFALEACGGFTWVFDLLVARYGPTRVHLAQPRRIQMIANSTRKNDRQDAFWLAYLTYEGRLPEVHVPGPLHRELRIATRERTHAVRARSNAVRRIRGHLRQMGVRLPTVAFDTKTSRAFLEDLIQRTPGARGEALREGLAEFDYLGGCAARWEEQIDRLCEQLPEARVLRQEIPGVGRILSATILAEIGDPGRFRSAKALARFTGRTPSDRSTGGVQIHGGITREGSPYLRWALTQAVTCCQRCRSGPGLAIRNWTRAHARRLGTGKARAAAARKLAESIWRLFKLGELFDATRCFGGPAVSRRDLQARVGQA